MASLTGDFEGISIVNDIAFNIHQYKLGIERFAFGYRSVGTRQTDNNLVGESGEVVDNAIEMHVFCYQTITIKFATYDSAIVLLNKHGETCKVAPTADKVAVFPLPSIHALKTGNIRCGINKELLTLGTIVVECT